MKVQEPDANGITYLKCEYCNGGESLITKPVPTVILPTLVCRDCRRDASGQIVPVAELPAS